MDADSFLEAIREEFALGRIDLGFELSLVDDVGLDSLDVVHLVVVLEEWADVGPLPHPSPEITTVGEAFHYYRQLCAGEPPRN